MTTTNPAEAYEVGAVPTFFGPWATRLLGFVSPQPGQRVLDVGCGTGIVARRIAPRVGSNGAGHVVGLDLSRDMLTVARAAAEREGLAIEWREGRAEELPFPDRSFDLALSQFALMFFADRHAALAEVRRVLTEGGRVALNVLQGLDRHPFYAALHGSIHRRFGMSGVGDIFSLGDADGLRGLLTGAGFRGVEIEPVSMTVRWPNAEEYLTWEIDVDTAAIPSMQHLDAAARQAITSAIREDVEGPLREFTEGDEVVMPFHAHVARAHR